MEIMEDIVELKKLFDSLGRGTSGRLIIEVYEEEHMREIIGHLFASEIAKKSKS